MGEEGGSRVCLLPAPPPVLPAGPVAEAGEEQPHGQGEEPQHLG